MLAVHAHAAVRQARAPRRAGERTIWADAEPAREAHVANLERRRILLSTVVPALAQLPPANAEAPDAGGPRLTALTPATLALAKGMVCVVTGATAGVGLEAARNLVCNGAEVYVCGRTAEKANAAVADILDSTKSQASPGKAMPMELDLASLASIRSFAASWKAAEHRPIDVLALNAGLALQSGLKAEEALLSRDGLELTVATNHLGHFLLYNLLQDQLGTHARVVVTASSVHDPAAGDPGAQATLGDLSGFRQPRAVGLMVDGGAYDSGKAYKDSKLCNVLFTLELARRLKQQGSMVTANCLSPGLIPSKTFFRNQSPGFADAFAFAARSVLRIAETTEFGGDALTFMALDPSLSDRSGLFYSAVPPGQHVFTERTPSPEARDAEKAAELWRLSAAIVGV